MICHFSLCFVLANAHDGKGNLLVVSYRMFFGTLAHSRSPSTAHRFRQKFCNEKSCIHYHFLHLLSLLPTYSICRSFFQSTMRLQFRKRSMGVMFSLSFFFIHRIKFINDIQSRFEIVDEGFEFFTIVY